MKSIARQAVLLLMLLPASALAASGGRIPGEEIVGRADDEDPKAFLKRVKGDLAKVDASIDATKELLSKSKDSPLLPDVMLRLAELYVEKSRLLYYKAVEERGTKSGGEAIAAPDSKYFKELAIEQYKKILKEFPAYPQNDKIRFFLGHEYQELAMPQEMLREYTRLTTDYPDSPLVPEAFLILGNFYFEKRDFETSQRQYEEVVKRNDAGLAALARYKLGWIEMNRTEHKKALAHFEAAARAADAFAMKSTNASLQQRQKLKNVRREALTDSVQPFTEVRKPEEAVAFYGELADTRNLYSAILEKLGNRYYVQQNWAPSAKIYRTLVTLTHDVERAYEFGQRFFECSTKAVAEAEKKPNAPSREKLYAVHFDSDDARSLTETMVRFSSSWRIPKKDRDAGVKEYELYVRDISTKLQLASEKEPDSNRKKALAWEASKAYAAYLSFFKDPAQRNAMEENYAEALAVAGKHWESARQYEKIARNDKKNEKELVHDALAEFHLANADKERMTRFRRVQAREGEKKLGEYYAQVYPDGKDVASVEFNVARSYYEEGNYKVAVDLFRQYIDEHPGAKESYASANLMLDSYAQMEDFAKLSENAKKLSGDPKLPDPKFRSQFAEIAKQADFRRVGTLLAEGDSDEDPAEKLARLAESSAGSELGEKALYTLFVTNRDRGESEKIFDAGERFLARYPTSEFSGEVLGSIAKLAIESADFSRAAAYYERFAKARPSDKGAGELLERAATIREKMGDANRAAAAYQALPKMGRIPAKDAALRSVNAYRAVGDWPKAANAARALIAAGHDGPYAHFVIGWAALKAGRADDAKLEFTTAVGRARQGQIQTSEDKDAAARAMFLLADESKRDFDTVQYANAEDVGAIQRRLALLQQLEADMAEVVKMGSGEWAIAATFRVGQGYRQLAEFIRKAPVPPGLSNEEKSFFAKQLDDTAAPLDQKAKESFAACLGKANELKLSSPWVAACAANGSREPAPEINPPPPRGGRAKPPAELTRALAKDPLNADLLTRIATGYLNNGDPYTAELVARRAIEVDDTKSEAHTTLALALLKRGEIADAADSFEAAAERAPGRPKEWLNWAAHQYAYGDPRKAVVSLKRAQNVRSVDTSAADVHPQARRLMTDAPRLMSMK